MFKVISSFLLLSLSVVAVCQQDSVRRVNIGARQSLVTSWFTARSSKIYESAPIFGSATSVFASIPIANRLFVIPEFGAFTKGGIIEGGQIGKKSVDMRYLSTSISIGCNIYSADKLNISTSVGGYFGKLTSSAGYTAENGLPLPKKTDFGSRFLLELTWNLQERLILSSSLFTEFGANAAIGDQFYNRSTGIGFGIKYNL